MDGVNAWSAIRDGKAMKRPPVVVAGSGGMAILQDQRKLSKSGERVTLYDLVADLLEARLSKAMVPFVEMLAKGSGRTFRPGGAGGRAPRRGGEARRGTEWRVARVC